MIEPVVVVLRWNTPIRPELWDRIGALGSARDREGDDGSCAVGPVLPAGSESRVASLTVRQVEETHLHWILLLHPPPEGDPPEEIVAESARVGGHQGLHALIQEGMGAAPANASLVVHLDLPGSAWTCRALRAEAPALEALVAPLGERALREQIGYRFEEGLSGLREVSVVYGHREEIYHVNLRAQIAWMPQARGWLSEDHSLSNLIVGTMFSSREGT